jgi:hypothetical protein
MKENILFRYLHGQKETQEGHDGLISLTSILILYMKWNYFKQSMVAMET